MSAYAANQKAYRARAKAGLACYTLELPAVELETMLVDIGFLGVDDVDDRDKVEAALQRFNQETIAEHMASRYP